MLGQVREEIKVLKAREAAIREEILDLRMNAPLEGASHVVTVRRGVRRSFDKALLPEHIREDPRYWKETESQTVVVKPRKGADDEDVQLIE
jgi:hypothetical protein